MSLVDYIAPGNPRARMGLEREIVQKLLATLNRRYPNAVQELQVDYDLRRAETMVAIVFKNGYVVRYPFKEIESLECQGMCVMVYDLPAIEVHNGRNT